MRNARINLKEETSVSKEVTDLRVIKRCLFRMRHTIINLKEETCLVGDGYATYIAEKHAFAKEIYIRNNILKRHPQIR